MTSHSPLIRLENISFSYPGRGVVLDHVNLEINGGERIGLIGPNGSGKTTLFHIIMGLLKPTSGNIEIFGQEMKTDKDFKEAYKKVGLLFQDADDQLFCPTVLEDVAFGPLNLGKSKDEAKALARRTLARLGIADFESRVTHRLSGGEKRLVALATVLSMEPEVLLLDEPSTGLDEKTKKVLIDVLTRLELSYILISHEFDFVNAVADRVFSMEKGKILTDEEIYIHHHEHIHRHGNRPHVHK